MKTMLKWWDIYSSYKRRSPREHSFPTPPVKPVVMAFTKSYDRPYEQLENGIYTVTTEDIRWLR